jgi:DHA3 family macrolide efflux protein-like MFS transporter
MHNWKKNTVLFILGQGLSLFGSMLVQYAITWHVTLKTQSGSMMTLFIVAGILPMFFISPFAGVWADRFNRKYLINGADASIAVVSLLMATCFFTGFDSIWLLFACAGLRAFGQGVQQPAVNAFIPELVPQEHLARVNGINGSIQSFSMLAAPALSGVLLSVASIEYIFFVDVVTAVIGISIVFFWVKPLTRTAPSSGNPTAAGAETVKTAEDADTVEKKTGRIDYFHDLKEGFAYIRRHRFILELILFSTLFFIIAAPSAFLTPLQVTRDFGAEVWRLTAVEMAFSIGMILGGILLGMWGGFKNKVHSMGLAWGLFGLEAVALGLLPHFTPYIAVMALCGITMQLYNMPSMTLMQTRIEPAFMGRVFSVFGMVSSLVMPAGMLIWGPLADIVPIRYLLIITGAVLALSAIPFLASKALREAGKPTVPSTPG